jgi:hypothetical protein
MQILGSVPLTNGSGYGSGMLKNIRIRIRIPNTGRKDGGKKRLKEKERREEGGHEEKISGY